MLNLKSSKDKFSKIYKHNLWLSTETGSGKGSEVEYTAPFRKWLIKNIASNQTRDIFMTQK